MYSVEVTNSNTRKQRRHLDNRIHMKVYKWGRFPGTVITVAAIVAILTHIDRGLTNKDSNQVGRSVPASPIDPPHCVANDSRQSPNFSQQKFVVQRSRY